MRLTKPPATDLKPLKVTCTSSDCPSGLHCFKPTRKMRMADQTGRCRSCGADLVDWERIKRHDLSDTAYTFQALKYEMYRHHYWHSGIDEVAVNHARRKGRAGMRDAARNRIRKSVGSAAGIFDGRQTPRAGNATFYAQHATAACCRGCIERWHAIPKDRPLTEDEVRYLTDLLMLYVNERLPDLTENGEKVPSLRARPPMRSDAAMLDRRTRGTTRAPQPRSQ